MIPIFITIDEPFARYASTCIMSLIDNSSKDKDYLIHVIHKDLSDESINKLKSLETDNVKLKFIKMDELKDIVDANENKLRSDFFTITIFFRIFIAKMFPEFDKGVYIDTDVILNDDISNLYNINLDGNLIGAIKDSSVSGNPVLAQYMEKAVGVDRYSYINSGVLLLNMKKLREIKFADHFLYLLNKYHFDTIAPDQDYFNAMCKDHIKFIDDAWDAMPVEGKKEMENPSLIHYNLFFKPWHYKETQYKDYFWK